MKRFDVNGYDGEMLEMIEGDYVLYVEAKKTIKQLRAALENEVDQLRADKEILETEIISLKSLLRSSIDKHKFHGRAE